MNDRAEIRSFFTTRRARLSPRQCGWSIGDQRRRVPGLRREEVAHLAGISVEYYTRIERGNLDGVSDAVLHALARALWLDESEVDYLHALAGRASHCDADEVPLATVASAPLRRVVDALEMMPAFACNARLDVLAINDLARSIFFPASGVVTDLNLAQLCFTDDRARQIYPHWEVAAEITVSLLRVARSRLNSAPGVVDEFISNLYRDSSEFRVLWDEHDVSRRFSGSVEIIHPAAGVLRLWFEQLESVAQPGVTVHVLSAEPGSVTEERLRALRQSVLV